VFGSEVETQFPSTPVLPPAQSERISLPVYALQHDADFDELADVDELAGADEVVGVDGAVEKLLDRVIVALGNADVVVLVVVASSLLSHVPKPL
jgi:hypothetical protein